MPFIIANANDSDSLKKLAAQTDVIIAVAGPYAKFGSKVVEAAVEQGTNYCDITGGTGVTQEGQGVTLWCLGGDTCEHHCAKGQGLVLGLWCWLVTWLALLERQHTRLAAESATGTAAAGAATAGV